MSVFFFLFFKLFNFLQTGYKIAAAAAAAAAVAVAAAVVATAITTAAGIVAVVVTTAVIPAQAEITIVSFRLRMPYKILVTI